jgi:tyrosine-protein phosphatase YwqE
VDNVRCRLKPNSGFLHLHHENRTLYFVTSASTEGGFGDTVGAAAAGFSESDIVFLIASVRKDFEQDYLNFEV